MSYENTLDRPKPDTVSPTLEKQRTPEATRASPVAYGISTCELTNFPTEKAGEGCVVLFKILLFFPREEKKGEKKKRKARGRKETAACENLLQRLLLAEFGNALRGSLPAPLPQVYSRIAASF